LSLCSNPGLELANAFGVREEVALANITLLHWNIYQFSNNKLNNANGAALINYIAEVVAQSGANIVSLLELKNSAVNNILAQLIPAINMANGVAPLNPWSSISINSQKNNEAYVVLWQAGHNFNWLMPAAGGGIPVSGLTNQTLLLGGNPGGVLVFNSSLTISGGRKPYYVTFRTTDTNHNFTIVAYHTMFGRVGGLSRVGVRSIGRLGQSRAVLDAGVTVNMDSSLTCGDFNVDFDPLIPGDYNNLLHNIPSSQSTNERTSLVNFTPAGGYPFSVQYRANAYDNIFKYNSVALPPAADGFVVDLIYRSTTPATGSGVLANEAGAFVPGPILDGNLIQNIPPQDFEDAWHIVRHAISDHLPVYVTMGI
jgi:hypothetical protein